MSVHINATKGQVAESVLMPGDPLRAKFIAEHYLTEVEQYNAVRNMFGYTGLYKGQRVSVQGSGWGFHLLRFMRTNYSLSLVQNASSVSVLPAVCKKMLKFVILFSTRSYNRFINFQQHFPKPSNFRSNRKL